MKNLFIVTSLIIQILVCTQCKLSRGKLTASLENIPDSTILNIIDADNGKSLARIQVVANKFEFVYSFDSPKKVIIKEDNVKYSKYQKVLWLENKRINITGNYDYFLNANVEGSASNVIHEKFDTLVRKFESRLSDLRLTGRITIDQLSRDSIEKEINRYINQHIEDKTKLYFENIESDVVLSNLEHEIVNYFSVFKKADINQIYQALPERFRIAEKGLTIKKYLSLPESPKIGDLFIDCTQRTPDGNTESISQNLGKYTIIEFWSSSCGPCRAEHSLKKSEDHNETLTRTI